MILGKELHWLECRASQFPKGRMTSKEKRQLLSAKQLKKLLKKKEPAFLALVRPVGGSTQRQGASLATSQTLSHGVTEKAKREQMKAPSPKKSFLTVEERKEEIFPASAG